MKLQIITGLVVLLFLCLNFRCDTVKETIGMETEEDNQTIELLGIIAAGSVANPKGSATCKFNSSNTFNGGCKFK